VLILGGTGEARGLAGRLAAAGHHVVTSLAGVTSAPQLPAGEVRSGGFGGIDGLADYLKAQGIDWLIDATHPFAAQISAHALAAAGRTAVRLVRLERPVWVAGAGDDWTPVADTEAAVAVLPAGGTALITIGRKEVAAFAARGDIGVVARMIEAPAVGVPENWRLVLARPPFTLEDELALMRKELVTVVVAKNAGGPGTAKLEAARELRLPVVMIERPPKPATATAATIEDVQTLIKRENT
jgi:precorrin-6A/cobalt-precorrin-6A reductase